MNERLRLFIEHLKNSRIVHNYADFASQLGKSRSIISEMINGKRTISESFVHELASAFPLLNEEWLLSGTGNMIVEEQNSSYTTTLEESNQDDKWMVDKLLFLVESQRKDIETLIQLVKEKDEKINELLNELNERKKETAPNARLSSSVNAG